MSRICLVDFDDSFTRNIYTELLKLELSVDFIHWKNLSFKKDYSAYIFGPGPGHITEYQKRVFPILEEIIKGPQFLMGICLGHQLICSFFGAKILKWDRPYHGERKNLSFKVLPFKGDYTVQLYNSWGVDPLEKVKDLDFEVIENKVLGSLGHNIITYQFHPESIGTSCPSAFFGPITNFIYNIKDGSQVSN